VRIISVLIDCVKLYELLWRMTGPSQDIFNKLEKDEMAMYELIAALLQEKEWL